VPRSADGGQRDRGEHDGHSVPQPRPGDDRGGL
jgi:hypothetical protein